MKWALAGAALASLVAVTSTSRASPRRPAEDAARPAGAPGTSNERHTVSLELLGHGGLYSLNYELRVWRSLRLRVGGSYFEITATNTTSRGDAALVGIPLVASGSVGGDRHRLELGAGATLFHFSGTLQVALLRLERDEIVPAATALVGYRFQPAGSGVGFRAGFTPLVTWVGGLRAIPWAGMSVGYTF